MPTLFNLGEFKLHSGENSIFKIDCDALTPTDWQAVSQMACLMLPQFGPVEGVPAGGMRFATVMRLFSLTEKAGALLIVDDVLTTGASMEAHRAGRDAIGVVLFARGKCPDWVTPIFQMGVTDAD